MRQNERLGRSEEAEASIRDEGMKVERIPLHKQNIVTGSGLLKPGFMGYWQNDLPGIIEAMLRAGWTFVEGDASRSHDSLSKVESPWGNVVRRVMNQDPNAASHYGYLMQIPKELYEEDKKARNDQIDERERAFDPTGRHSELYGKFERTRET